MLHSFPIQTSFRCIIKKRKTSNKNVPYPRSRHLFSFSASLSLPISPNHRLSSKPASPSIRPSSPRQTRDRRNNTNDTPTQPREPPGYTQPSTKEPTRPSPPTYLQLPISTDPAWTFTATTHVPIKKTARKLRTPSPYLVLFPRNIGKR
jgi:hypothetical protein